MRSVTVARRTQFRPHNMPGISVEEAKRIDWNLLLDPQHASRQSCLDSANWLNTTKCQNGGEPAMSVWQFRGYNCYVSPEQWNPFNLPIIGPQWSDDTYPTALESDKPDEHCRSIDWFYGYLHSCGITVDSLHPHLMPYVNYYVLNTPWGGLEPMSYRPNSYYMQWHDRNWQDRMVDYHTKFAQWASDKIQGPQSLMLGTLKRHQVWPPSVKLERLYRKASETRTAPNALAPMSWWMQSQRYNPKSLVRSGSGGTNPMAFPSTDEIGWWKGVCSIPGKLRWRLDRAGLRDWKVIVDFGSDKAYGGYFYTNDYYISSKSQAIDWVYSNALKAAWGADMIIWDSTEDEWFKRHRPWVMELKSDMSSKTELVSEDSW